MVQLEAVGRGNLFVGVSVLHAQKLGSAFVGIVGLAPLQACLSQTPLQHSYP